MHVDQAFRLSNYLTLGLACGCLGYAELPFLPAVTIALLPIGLLLLLAFFLERRWSIPGWGANLAGGILGVGTAVWVVRLSLQQLQGYDLTGLPWPASLLPSVGPLLMLLMLAKLFRPKQRHDYWLLQTIGLLQVVLACVLAGEAFFAVLLYFYLASGLWCLSLMQLHPLESAERQDPPSALRAPRSPLVPWRMLGLAQAGGRALAAFALGLMLFLVIPRQTNLVWDSSRLTASRPQRMETGFSNEIDLNQSGSVRVNDEVAFEVIVVDSRGRPRTNLGGDQRWRSVTLEHYSFGRWYSDLPRAVYQQIGVPPPRGRRFAPEPKLEHAHLHRNTELPNLGDQQYFLTFTLDRREAGGFFLAEPVVLGPGATVHPYKCLTGSGLDYEFQLFYEIDGTLCQLPRPRSGRYTYVQVTAPPAPDRADLNEPRWLAFPDFGHLNFNHVPLPSLRTWLAPLLSRLAKEGRYGLTPEHIRPAADGTIQARHREAVAHALCRYLATSGEYTYSLVLRRADPILDPAVDFLLNVRQGHCERFAGALALLLRSQGIPTRLVNGFRGAEHQGKGRYLVRQSNAHTWVEALVPAREAQGRSCWLTLDPTPAVSADQQEGIDLAHLWEQAVGQLEALWRSFVVDFNPEHQQEALAGLGRFLAGAARPDRPGFWMVALPAAFGLVWLRKRFRRRRVPAGPRAAPGWGAYTRLLAILARRCRLKPNLAQTPREFAAAARGFLQGVPTAGPLADLPGRVAAVFYQVRYGGRSLPEEETQEIDRQLDRLDLTLAADAKLTGEP